MKLKKIFLKSLLKTPRRMIRFFFQNDNKTFNFDLRGFINKKFKDLGVLEIENILIDTFDTKNGYFSHRRAKKLGENDYGRCISVIKKIKSQK